MSQNDKTIRCTRCAAEFTEAEIQGYSGCPKCGTKSVPMSIPDDVTIKVNLHELRILGIWAENYAVATDNAQLDNPNHEPLKETVNAICDRLQAQLKALGKERPLTLSREFGELVKQNPNAQMFRGGHEEIPPAEKS